MEAPTFCPRHAARSHNWGRPASRSGFRDSFRRAESLRGTNRKNLVSFSHGIHPDECAIRSEDIRMNRDDPRRGTILVAVLWSITLLSALAMATSTTFRGFAAIMVVDRDRIQ